MGNPVDQQFAPFRIKRVGIRAKRRVHQRDLTQAQAVNQIDQVLAGVGFVMHDSGR